MSEALDRAIEKFNAEPEPVEYKPMADAFAEPKKEEKEFSSDADGLKKAAKDVEEQRAAGEQAPPIERTYSYVGGEDDGKPVAPNETLSIDRAAADLTRQRDFEAAVEQQQTDEVVANVVDANSESMYFSRKHNHNNPSRSPNNSRSSRPRFKPSSNSKARRPRQSV